MEHVTGIVFNPVQGGGVKKVMSFSRVPRNGRGKHRPPARLSWKSKS